MADEVPGVHIMSRIDLEAAVGGMSPDDDWDGAGATSREDAARKRELARYRDDPDLCWRRHVIADDAMLARVGRLVREAPNMARAVEIVRRAAVVSRYARQPLRVPPIVLVGPPGCGKTRFASLLAGALGVSSSTIVGSTITDVGKIIGYHPGWKGASPGLVAKSLMQGATASPVIVVDEAEKIQAVDGLPYPLDALLSALESGTACYYRDGYLDVPMRAEGIVWLFCGNDLHGLSAPLLDRCVVIEVAALSGRERHRALDDLAADILLDHGVAPTALDIDALAVLDGVGLRRARALIASALAGALDAGRDALTADDLRAAAALLGGAPRIVRQRAGFVQF
ncbi:AAA family ATPase [Lichenibacterium dinghuense]|uniref:AAA family ATPase n=1 Tax=Lichenibacterium dinghuense TaxID=2895977 RepID=UPI001F00AF07|nr:AAA family ATPase [Lichenibacterium sp. 6Y81]